MCIYHEILIGGIKAWFIGGNICLKKSIRRFWGTRRSQWGRVAIFPGPTHLRLSFGGGFTVVAPLGAALEFFENRACPGNADFGVSRHPENRVRAVRGRWVGRGWGYGSAAPGGLGTCLGLPQV